MRLPSAVLIAITFALAGHGVPLLRAACAAISLNDDFEHSERVFLGLATDQSILSTPPASMERATETTFEIERSWKGKPAKTVRVVTCGGTVGNSSVWCGEAFNFKVGARYLVFAHGQPLQTSQCRHTSRAEVEGAKDTLRWLEENQR
jgi:predicted metal-binding protein